VLSEQASRTIVRPALLRAAHQLLDDDPKVLVDPVAVGFVPELSKDAILAQAEALRAPRALLLRSLMVMRSRCAEDRFEQSLQRDIRQIVLLGAGLDTYAWRQPAAARQATLFFVDHPATLAATRAALAAQGRAAPRNLRFVPCNLDAQDLEGALGNHGFDAHQPAIVSALGLFQYLRADTVDAVLATIACWAPGSEIVFTRVLPPEELGGDDLAESCASAGASARMDEPWLTVLPSEAWATRLAALGLLAVNPCAVLEEQRRLFATRRDGLRAPQFEQMLIAMVPRLVHGAHLQLDARVGDELVGADRRRHGK
jgi:methyltransferase (TIGR00027 family)